MTIILKIGVNRRSTFTENVIVDWHKQLIVLLKLPTLPSVPSAIMKAVAKNKEKNFFSCNIKNEIIVLFVG